MRTVFVSYRRGDSEGQARALNFELVKMIGKDSVFMDVDSIALGQDFRQILHQRLESCDLMLALIGPGWLDARDSAGNRRLESATDLVRQEIAAALKRNIPVTPVLLQGAQVPPPERLPEDIRELVYRNGFELGHSTWESDVTEMLRRLGLDKEFAAPANAPQVAEANAAKLAAPRSFGTSWLLSTFVVIGIVAAVLFYRKAHDQTSVSEVAAPLQQPVGSSSQQSAGPSPPQSNASSPQQSAGSPSRQPGGFGAIKITNLKALTVEVYDQSSSGEHMFTSGYAGKISPTATTLQVPTGTYKLKFDQLFVEHVAITSAATREILLGAISLPNLTRTVEVYDQSSSGEHMYTPGYAGKLSPTATTLQVPTGTYKLKFDQLFVEHVAITSAATREILLGAISLPNFTRTAEVYEQSSSGEHMYVPGYAGTISPTATTLQVPSGTYKLKLANQFVQPIRVESGKTVIAK
jgi:TIR domain-containing protein